jgi:T5SS/PEP-CTERM-associated repeat protein
MVCQWVLDRDTCLGVLLAGARMYTERAGGFLRIVALTPILLLFPTAAVAAGDQGIAPSALAEIQALEQEKAMRTPAQQKMDSNLIYARRKLLTGVASTAAPHLQAEVKMQTDGRVPVDITATVSDDLLAFITNGGGEIINSFPQYNAIRALVPLRDIESIAERPDVRFVDRAREPKSNSCTYTGADYEGDICHEACNARDTYGVDGTNVIVGVLSGSDTYLATAQSNGTLGAVITLPGQSGVPDPAPDPGEGTAMMEIVHRIAPGAQLYFATAAPSQSQMAANIFALAAAGCNIIVDDVTYDNESPFQEGQPISEAVHDVSDQGILYFSSAGNHGNYDSAASCTWDGDFVDGGAPGFPFTVTNFNGKVETVGQIHSFGGGTNYNTVVEATTAFDLFWTDPLGASTNDYDLFVLDSTGTTVLGASTTTQNGTQDPYESVSTNFSYGSRVVIVKYSGDNRFLQLESGYEPQFNGDVGLAINTPGRIKGHNCVSAQNAFCVAATSVANTEAEFGLPTPFTGGPANPVEYYSSDGPHHLFFYPGGLPITPGNFSSTGGTLIQKPDITAGDHVYGSAVPGFSPFSGTSAAAPQAAGIAALVLSASPSLTPLEARIALEGSALTNGMDRDSGYGIVMATAVGLVSNVLSEANSWTNSASGKWEVPANWSKGVAPTTAHVAIIISNAPSKTVTIDNVTTNTPGNLTINYLTISAPVGSTNVLFLNRSGTLTPLTVFNGLVLDTNGAMAVNGSEFETLGGVVVGNTGGNSTLIITNGGFVYDDSCLVGVGSNGDGNVVLVAGPGSVLYSLTDLGIGWSGSGNGLTISNQAQAISTDGAIGFNASSTGNSVLVTGPGSVWYNDPNPEVGNLSVGYNGAGNTLTIANGGAVYSDSGAVGFYSDNNVVAVGGSGTNSIWSNIVNLYVGGFGVTNQLTISANGSVVASNAYIGYAYTNAGNAVTVAGGGLFATAALDVRQGTLALNSGSVTVTSLIATNGAASVLQFNGGTVNSGGTSVTNGQIFAVGNGSSAATFALFGGVHSFANGLRVRTNAVLSGCGVITGAVVVDPGGTVLANCGGVLTFIGSVTNSGIMHAENGSVLESYGPVVNNGIIDIMDGATNFHSTFLNNGTVVNASYFRVVNAARQTNDINLTWTTVGGRDYVVQTNAPEPNGSYTTNFTDLSIAVTIPGASLGTTNYLDVGGATNVPARYYRVRLVP